MQAAHQTGLHRQQIEVGTLDITEHACCVGVQNYTLWREGKPTCTIKQGAPNGFFYVGQPMRQGRLCHV
jgi:hypothetical protein